VIPPTFENIMMLLGWAAVVMFTWCFDWIGWLCKKIKKMKVKKTWK